MSDRVRVYLAGPITQGDREHNFNQAADAHKDLLLAGFAVLNPMLSMKLPGCWDIPHRTWLDSDLPWVECAEAVLRLPGASMGADEEVEHAKEFCIPVFTDAAALIEHFHGEGE